MRSFLALGDSYTIGESVSASERWPELLAARLGEAGIECSQPRIIAKTGWTTDELRIAVEETCPVGPYNLVSLLIGVNDQYRGRNVDAYRSGFRSVLELAIGYSGGHPHHLVVLSIPDWGVTPFAEGRDRTTIAREIDALNDINFRETVRAGAHYVDITPLSREAAHNRSLIAEDGLHPSSSMYIQWVDLLLPRVLRILME